MTIFGTKSKDTEAEEAGSEEQPPTDGQEFFEWARGSVAEAMEDFASRAEEYDDAEAYIVDLFEHVWPVIDKALKASYRNGRNGRKTRRFARRKR